MKKQITATLASLAAFGALAAPQALAADSGAIEGGLAPQGAELGMSPDPATPEGPETIADPADVVEVAPEGEPLGDPGELTPTKGDDGEGAKPKKIERGEDEKITETKTIGAKTGKGGATDGQCAAAADALDYFQGLLTESLIHDVPSVGILAGASYDLIKSMAESRGCTFGTYSTTY